MRSGFGLAAAFMAAFALAASPLVGAVLLPVAVPLPCDAGVVPPGTACGTWRRVPDLPEAREGLSVIAAHPAEGEVVLAHGGRDADGAPQGQLWAWHTAGAAWAARTPGPPRADAVLAVDDARGVAYLFGGTDAQGVQGDTWAYDIAADAWSLLMTGPGPGARAGAAGAWDAADGWLVVFGGVGPGGTSDGDVWRLDPAAGTWTLGSNAPQARSFAGAAWDARAGVLAVHGGLGNDGRELSDSWTYAPRDDLWAERSPGPMVRARAAAAVDADGALLLVGGTSDGAALRDAWAFQAVAPALPFRTPPAGVWWQQAGLPAPRAAAAGTWAQDADAMVVVGGAGESGPTSEAWLFRPSALTALP